MPPIQPLASAASRVPATCAWAEEEGAHRACARPAKAPQKTVDPALKPALEPGDVRGQNRPVEGQNTPCAEALVRPQMPVRATSAPLLKSAGQTVLGPPGPAQENTPQNAPIDAPLPGKKFWIAL